MEVSTSVKGAVNLNALFIFISRAVHIYFPCRFRELDQQHDVSVELPSQFKSTGGKKSSKSSDKGHIFPSGQSKLR